VQAGGDAVLALRDVSKTYGDLRALDTCTFQVVPGRLTGFVGPNGAGKTTAMRVIFGLAIQDAGIVTWNGQVVDAAARRRFGYMPEERGLYPRMRVREQLVFLGRLSGLTPAEAAGATDRWLDALGLTDRATARVDDLSHGNQQRVQFAAALLHAPELLVLDEPFSGLDPFAMDSMSQLLTEVAHAGTAVLFSSHQLDAVEHLCEDVVVVDAGRVVLTGALDALRNQAAERYLEVTFADRAERLLNRPGATLVEQDGSRVRLRVPRSTNPLDLLAGLDGDVVRLSFEPPPLSELFRTAVRGNDVDAPEVVDVLG
jgi:ABC-2 type transport system ATP-binding protein